MKNKLFANSRIGILGKGGSGKSTITVLMAKAFQNQGFQVCVLDADSTNTGIHRALGFKNPPVSLLDYFGGPVFTGGGVTCPVDDPTPLSNAMLDLAGIPEKYFVTNQKGLFLFQLGKMGSQGPGAGCDGPISKITRDVNVVGIGDQLVTLIDVKAGLEDTARGVITSMDWIITIVDPTTASVQIATDINNLISRIKAGELPATEHLDIFELIEMTRKTYREARIKAMFVLLNKINNKKTEHYLIKKLKENGLGILGTIYDDPSISLAWLKGKSLESKKANEEIITAIKKLERGIKKQQGTYDLEEITGIWGN